MPGYNECGIYDPRCVKGTCNHPTNPRNSGMQCRTMPAQRPCRTGGCTRPECSRARLSASAFQAGMVTDTTSGTNIGSVPPQVDVIKSREEEPTYSLTGLTRANLRTLERALRARERDAKVGDDYAELRTLRDMVCDLL
ncbi:hypothetical protein HWB05_gp008 [Streptomyces phage BRock]|uniref:Uncharacterized protein n=1 Tax=Streptomyces phage BRock TaxID=1913591 RepID=A0A1J0GVR9_9CAUD|nr:hypothetical protein HWB05_gp008 [Streptomyces phage BRock]APC46270.1 hypothetical protein [Streptomyces phage BRock]